MAIFRWSRHATPPPSNTPASKSVTHSRAAVLCLVLTVERKPCRVISLFRSPRDCPSLTDYAWSLGEPTAKRLAVSAVRSGAIGASLHLLQCKQMSAFGEERKSHRVRRSRSLVSSISTASRSQRPPSTSIPAQSAEEPVPTLHRALNSCLVFAGEPNRQAAFRWSGDEAQTRPPRGTRRRITCTDRMLASLRMNG